jgi:hypothetical protein
VPGEYNILVSVRLGLEVADKFTSPLRLVVTEGPFFPDHRAFDKAWGDILVKQCWHPEHGHIQMAEPPRSC